MNKTFIKEFESNDSINETHDKTHSIKAINFNISLDSNKSKFF